MGYGDPKVKTFDGYSFSLDKTGAFNIATDRDGLFTVRGLNAPCGERLSCVLGLEVEHNGHSVNVRRNLPVSSHYNIVFTFPNKRKRNNQIGSTSALS